MCLINKWGHDMPTLPATCATVGSAPSCETPAAFKVHKPQLVQTHSSSKIILTGGRTARRLPAGDVRWTAGAGWPLSCLAKQATQTQGSCGRQALSIKAPVVTHLKASQKAALPTRGLPKVMHRTSAVGHCRAIQTAATVAMAPAPQ